MRILIRLLSFSLFLAASPCLAAYMNFNAAQMIADSTSTPVRGTCTAATSPACANNTHEYMQFTDSATKVAWIHTIVPQDIANRLDTNTTIGIRCGYSAWKPGSDADTGDARLNFGFQVFPATSDASPSDSGTAQTSNFTTFSQVSSSYDYYMTVSPAGASSTFNNVKNQATGTSCTASACAGLPLTIQISRVPGNASDTLDAVINVTDITCEY